MKLMKILGHKKLETPESVFWIYDDKLDVGIYVRFVIKKDTMNVYSKFKEDDIRLLCCIRK